MPAETGTLHMVACAAFSRLPIPRRVQHRDENKNDDDDSETVMKVVHTNSR